MKSPSTKLRVPSLSGERKGDKPYPCKVHKRLLFSFPALSLPVPSFVEGSKGPYLLFLLALSLSVTSCSKRSEPYKETRFMMGTIVEMVLYDDTETASAAAGKAFNRITRIEGAAHPWKDGSPLVKVRSGEKVHIEGDLAAILETAMKVSRISSGAFDPTLGRTVHLWGFGREDPGLPARKDVELSLVDAGYGRVPSGGCCPEGLNIWFDLGGVAKGYAVDDAVKILEKAGVKAGIVNAGGDLRSFGEHPRRGYWKIGVQDPSNPQELSGILEIKEAAVATSGDYQRYFEKDGIRYHHILDPTTGYPARSGLKGTTVIAPDCATADALATAAFVLGPEKGLALLEGWEGAEGVLITDDGTILTSSGIGEGVVKFEER